MAGVWRSYLLVVSDREALAWILREQRTAFPEERSRLSRGLAPGDRLVLYTTRGCFRNPTRDRGRLVATAEVRTSAHELDQPVVFGERSFTIGCDLSISKCVPWRSGPELVPLLPRLRTFPAAWGPHLRRALVPLDHHDYTVLARKLEPVAVSLGEALPEYLNHATPPRVRPVHDSAHQRAERRS